MQVSALSGQTNVMRQNLYDQTSMQLDSIMRQLTEVEAVGGEIDPTVDTETDQLRANMIDRLETLQTDLLSLAEDEVSLTRELTYICELISDPFLVRMQGSHKEQSQIVPYTHGPYPEGRLPIAIQCWIFGCVRMPSARVVIQTKTHVKSPKGCQIEPQPTDPRKVTMSLQHT